MERAVPRCGCSIGYEASGRAAVRLRAWTLRWHHSIKRQFRCQTVVHNTVNVGDKNDNKKKKKKKHARTRANKETRSLTARKERGVLSHAGHRERTSPVEYLGNETEERTRARKRKKTCRAAFSVDRGQELRVAMPLKRANENNGKRVEVGNRATRILLICARGGAL